MKLEAFLRREYAAGGPPVTWWVFQYLGGFMAFHLIRKGISANWTTLMALVLSLLGVGLYVADAFGVLSIIGAFFLLQLGYALDCADGQIARASQSSSDLGAWFDNVADIIAVSMLGLGCMSTLYSSGVSIGVAMMAVWAFMIGHSVLHYTSTRIRSHTDERIRTVGIMNGIRVLATSVLDKPTVIFLLCVFRDSPELLTFVLIFLGAGYVAQAIYSGRKLLS